MALQTRYQQRGKDSLHVPAHTEQYELPVEVWCSASYPCSPLVTNPASPSEGVDHSEPIPVTQGRLAMDSELEQMNMHQHWDTYKYILSDSDTRVYTPVFRNNSLALIVWL